MGFMDEVSSGGGTKLLKFDGKAGSYVVRGSEATFNGQEFLADVYSATGGFLKFNGKGQQPERRIGLVFPKDLAPARSSLGDLDQSAWANGRFSDGPEDLWTPVIELPLIHRESGEAFTFTAQSKTSLAAVKDFLGLCRKVPEGFLPIVRLDVGSFKGKFGQVKKPALSVIGKAPIETDSEEQMPWARNLTSRKSADLMSSLSRPVGAGHLYSGCTRIRRSQKFQSGSASGAANVSVR
jgi:hypothetical protein